MRAGLSVDKLDGDANVVAREADAPLKEVTNTKLLGDLAGIDRATFVDERGVARDHCERLEATERGDQVLNDAVGKVVF